MKAKSKIKATQFTFKKIGDITINTHDESKAMTHQNIAGTTQVLKIDQAKDFMFLVSDIDKVQANVELMTKYTNKAKKKRSKR